jgi:hypothetical protein
MPTIQTAFRGISIEDPTGDYNFSSQAKAALNILRSRPIGALLLRSISQGCTGRKNVVIEKSPTANAVPTNDTSDNFRGQLKQPGQGQLLVAGAYPLTATTGCSAIARWNPANRIPGTTIDRPSYVSLAHELIHCLHFVTGDCYRVPVLSFDLTSDGGLAEEEARTVGLGPYADAAMSENAIRAAFGLARRTEYSPGNDLSHVQATPHLHVVRNHPHF